MKRVVIYLYLIILIILGCNFKKENICKTKLEEIDWQFYVYNVYYKKNNKIPIFDEVKLKIVDSIPIHSMKFHRMNHPVFQDTSRVDIVFIPEDTTKQFIFSYVNTLRKVKGGNIDYITFGDRSGHSIDPINVYDSNRKFKEYLLKNKDELHPCLYEAAVERGFLNQ